ncbi:MAG: division/cell wall cluster transcriptional repressor MraZ [Acidobacteriia bacterium]|nr:division/cell wall cluster transcriptional repressor MraZ [Terriglobia bacterium]
MLRGNYPATVDGKGRLKIPTAFKAYLDENFGQDFYVTSLDGQSARIYPFPVWREIEEKLAAVPSMNKSKKRFLDRTNYWGQQVRADAQGRVLIPAHLRESAAMRGEVAVLGYLNYLDVWNAANYREHLDREPLTDDDLENLGSLGI